MFEKLGNMANMMKQAQQMQGKMSEIQQQLAAARVTGAAGAGMVEVTASGTGDILSVRIAPEVFAEGDREFIEGLIPQAINEALAKGKELHKEKIQELTGGLSLPGLDKFLGQ